MTRPIIQPNQQRPCLANGGFPSANIQTREAYKRLQTALVRALRQPVGYFRECSIRAALRDLRQCATVGATLATLRWARSI